MVSPTLSKEQSGKVSGSGGRYEFEAGGGRYYTLLLATACPDKASEVGQATRLRLVGRPLQKLERHKVAILVEEKQSHNQDRQKPPLSNHGAPSGGRDGGDWKMGGRGEGAGTGHGALTPRGQRCKD